MRTARRRWHQLAGIDADPYDAEAVIRAHDPQLAFDERVALASPTVRTVAAFHRKAQARWRVLWAGLGHDEPPEPEDLEATLDDVLGDHRRRQADLRLLEAAEARASAEADARRPLVLVEPRRVGVAHPPGPAALVGPAAGRGVRRRARKRRRR